MSNNSLIAGIGGGVAAVVVAIVVAVTMFSGASESPEPANDLSDQPNEELVESQDTKIKVFASFYPYYEFTRNVAGDTAIVEQYMPSGIEAHDWEPRPQEIQSLKDASVFVYNGLGMEPYVENIIESGEFDNVVFVKASDGVELIKPDEGHAEEFAKEIEHVIEEFEHGHMTESQAIEKVEEILHEHEGDGHDHGNETMEKIEAILHEIEDGHITAEAGFEEMHHAVLDVEEEGHDDHKEEKHDEPGPGHHHDFESDPHIWLDPMLVKQQVNNIRDGLIQADPQNKEQYETNAIAYNEKLDELDMSIRSSLSSCSKDTFVPFHNAFTYLGERYDLKIMSLGGLAPDSEATAAEIAEFVDFVKDNDIKVIFAEELVDPRLAEVIADEAGAQVMIFSPIEALAHDEVGKDITYLDKMQQNLDALKVALECQ